MKWFDLFDCLVLILISNAWEEHSLQFSLTNSAF